MAQVIDSDVVFDGKTGHNSYHTNIADMEGLICQALAQIAGTVSASNPVNIAAIQAFVAAGALGPALPPSGDTSGATDYANITAALGSAAPAVWLQPGKTYYSNRPISLPAKVLGSAVNGYRTGAGAVLQAAGGFSSAALIQPAAATPAGTVQGLILDGTGGGASLDGIGCYVNCKQGSVLDVMVRNFTGHGINITQNGGNPDGWLLRQISAHNNTGQGVNWDYAVDGQFDIFHCDNNGGHGVAFGTLNNMEITNGKCQQNTGANYGLTGGFIKSNATFTACMSENSKLHGWDLSGVNGQGTIKLVGCSARDEGTSGTSGSGFAGFNLGTPNTNMFLVLAGCDTYVTVSSAGQDYGLLLTGHTGWLTVEGGTLIGSVAGYHDGGGNTASQQLFDNTLTAAGQVGSLGTVTRLNT